MKSVENPFGNPTSRRATRIFLANLTVHNTYNVLNYLKENILNVENKIFTFYEKFNTFQSKNTRKVCVERITQVFTTVLSLLIKRVTRLRP